MGDAAGSPSSEGRSGASAVAPQPDAAQVGDHPIHYREANSVSTGVSYFVEY